MGDNPNWRRQSSAERKAAERARIRYLHVSVKVGPVAMNDGSGCMIMGRTPKGKGATARKSSVDRETAHHE